MDSMHRVYILTNFAFQVVIGYIGVYSITKASMAAQFSYDQQFLGVLQAIIIAGETIGSFFVLFLSLNSVKAFLIFSIINGVFGLPLFALKYINITILRDLIIKIALFGQGFTISSLVFTQIIFNHYFNDKNTKKCMFSIWYSLTFLGDIISVIFAQVLIYKFNVSWQWTKFIWNIIIVLVGLQMYFLFDHESEVQPQLQSILSHQEEIFHGQSYKKHENNEHLVLKKQIKSQEHEYSSNKIQNILILCKKIIQTLKQPRIALVTISFGLIQGLYTNMLFWIPYYFVSINQDQYSMLAILLCSLSIAVGGIFCQIILFQTFNLQKYNKLICYGLLVLSTISYILLWSSRKSLPYIQIFFLTAASFFMACPLSRISSTEPVQQAEQNPSKIRSIFLAGHCFRNIVIMFSVLLIGYLMKINNEYFWHVILINSILCLAVQSIRKFYFKQNIKQKKPIQLRNM